MTQFAAIQTVSTPDVDRNLEAAAAASAALAKPRAEAP